PFSKQTSEAPNEFVRIIDNKEKETIFLSIEYAQLPPASDFFIRVFINKPDANSKTSTDDPHFAGSFAFFGTEPTTVLPEGHGGHHHHPRFLVNVVPALQKLRASGE